MFSVRAFSRPAAGHILRYAYNRTFEVLPADTDSLREEVFRLRYQVFCVENPFENPAEHPEGLERDAYDSRARHVLLRHRGTGLFAGTIRVISPNPDDLHKSFPLQAVCAHPLLKDQGQLEHLCEISRLCVSQDFRRRLQDTIPSSGLGRTAIWPRLSLSRRLIPYIPLGLFNGAFGAALEMEKINCLAVMEPALLRVLRRIGFDFRPLGEIVEFHGRRQPVLFNIKHLFDGARREHSIFLPLVSGRGHLHTLASSFGESLLTSSHLEDHSVPGAK